MRQLLVRSVLCGLLLLLAPRPASAELGFFRWWDSLSGPGPFSGVVFDEVFLCKGEPTSTPLPRPKFDPGCLNLHRGKRRLMGGVKVGRLDGKNNLPYATGRAPEVHAYPVLATLSFSQHPALERGGAVGFVRFSGEGFGFNRFAIEPRVVFRPLVFFADVDSKAQRQLEFLHLQLYGTGIPSEFTAADFGAIGSFRSDREWLPCFAIIVDIGRVLWPGK